VNTIFLKHISDYLGCDRVEDDIVDEVDNLNNIIKPFNNDLIDNKLFIMKRMLNNMASFAIFLVSIHFPFNPFSSGLF
jgi:hypothetical protein